MVVVFVDIDGIVDLTATLILTGVIMHSLVYFFIKDLLNHIRNPKLEDNIGTQHQFSLNASQNNGKIFKTMMSLVDPVQSLLYITLMI